MTVADFTLVNCDLPFLDVTGLQAISVTNGAIAAVEPMTAHHGARTTVFDARGRSVIPAFTDAHVHLVESGVELARCDLSATGSRDQALARIAAYCANSDAEWIIGRGWSLDHFEDTSRMLGELDAITGARPAYLANKDGHSAWVNSAALARAGVDERTADPAGGRIERDADGAALGLLHESAMQLVSELMPPMDEATRLAGLWAGQQHLLSLGVTGWQEAIVGDFVPTTDVFATYLTALERGDIIGRATGNLWLPREHPEQALPQFIAARERVEPNDHLALNGVKVMYDGVCETFTAAISQPYADDAQTNSGLTFFEPAQLAPIMADIDRAGFDIHVHAIGDRATDEILTVFESFLRGAPARDHRHQIAHLQITNAALIDRMAALGIIANVQPFWAQADAQMTQMTLPYLAESLRATQYQFRSMMRAGVSLAFGSDWPVTTPNPMDWIHVAVNRDYPGETDGPFLPEEALSRAMAFEAATSGAARAARQDARGVIAPGRQADLVVLDRPLAEVPDKELYDVSVAATIARGNVVFER
ncbi:MAG: amidohydrolase [Mycobacterium sp.]